MSVEKLFRLSQKRSKYVIGLMSGTSVDGVSAALIKITGSRTATKLNFLGGINFPFPKGMREKILSIAEPGGGNTADICRMNFLISSVYVKAVAKLCDHLNFPLNKIDLIGSHGQTVHHLPAIEKLFGIATGSTLQIGDISVLSKQLGITTVGDFRTADVALGGEGAPFVPYFDYVILSSNRRNRALLNIGGIANITVLKKNVKPSEVIAFDTGPGNMMIDSMMNKFFGLKYDRDGRKALSGEPDEALLDFIKSEDSFISQPPPKSTGREFYNKDLVSMILDKSGGLKHEDIIATVTYYTAWTVFHAYQKFIRDRVRIDELFVSGGGAKNKALVKYLSDLFGYETKVKNVDELGVDSDYKEAICFAVLANETICGNPANLPSVTGASKATILGKISLP